MLVFHPASPGSARHTTGMLCSLLILIILVGGCGQISERFGVNNPSSPVETEGRTTGELADAELPADDDPCANDYYPIDTSVSREYTITGSAPGKYALTQTADEEGTFVENRRFGGGLEVTSTWVCTDQGLRNAEYNNMGTTGNATFTMETLKAEGVTFPKEWNLGDEWTTSYQVSANLATGPVKAAAAGTIEIVNEIISLDENVTVAGGTFAAARVDSEIRMNLTMRGQKLPSQPVKMTAWYAREVGMVKQEVKSGFGNQNVEYTGSK